LTLGLGGRKSTSPPAVSLIIHGLKDVRNVRQVILEAADVLAELEHEILVLGDEQFLRTAQDVRPELLLPANVRWIPCPVAGGYREVLHASPVTARAPQLVFSDGSLETSTLACLLPLAKRHALVSASSVERSGSLFSRALRGAYSALGTGLLDTRVRHCGASGMLMIQRSALQKVLPESEGVFTPAEVFARAKQAGLSVGELNSYAPAQFQSAPTSSRRGYARGLVNLLRFWWLQVQFPAMPAAASIRAAWAGGLAVALMAALVLFTDLSHALLDPDEGRQAEIPREMLAHHDLIVPRMMGLPYYDKPPLQYWLTAGAYRLLGTRPWVARLIPASAAWLMLMLVYSWAQRYLGGRAALFGCMGLVLTPGFVILGRTVTLDSLLTLCVAVGWFSAHAALSGPAFRWSWWLSSAVACGLGLLAKGPVALALVVPPVLAHQLLGYQVKRSRWLAWTFYVAVALAVAAPWYLAMAHRQPEYLEQFLWKANVLRFVTPFDHEHAWWYYLPVIFTFTFPWSLFWPALGYFLLSRRQSLARMRSKGLGFCALTLAWCLLFYSLSGCKSAPYVAPAMAPLALMLGAFLDGILFRSAKNEAPVWEHARQWLPRLVALLLLSLTGFCTVVTGWLGWQAWPLAIGESAVMLAVAAAWLRWGGKASPRLAWGVCAGAALAFNLLAVQDLQSGFGGRRALAAMTQVIRRRANQEYCPVICYRGQWPSVFFYLRRESVITCPIRQVGVLERYLATAPQVFVLVESGRLLAELLDDLPKDLAVEVVRPRREGQVALVVLQQHVPMKLH
jgi:dolichol-phosphate mannosyltransferase